MKVFLSYATNPEKRQFSILPSTISNFEDPVPIGPSDWHCFFFLLGMAVGAWKKKGDSTSDYLKLSLPHMRLRKHGYISMLVSIYVYVCVCIYAFDPKKILNGTLVIDSPVKTLVVDLSWNL